MIVAIGWEVEEIRGATFGAWCLSGNFLVFFLFVSFFNIYIKKAGKLRNRT